MLMVRQGVPRLCLPLGHILGKQKMIDSHSLAKEAGSVSCRGIRARMQLRH